MNIVKDYVPITHRNRPSFPMTPLYITIHETGNEKEGATARMHARYLKLSTTAVSWHYTVDDQDIAYQHLPTNENGWYAGDGRDGMGNRQSIGIELCVNKGSDFEKTRRNAAMLVLLLQEKYDIPLRNVVTHQQWSGKNCPRFILAAGGINAFHALITQVKQDQGAKKKEGKDALPESAKRAGEASPGTSIVDWMKAQGMNSSYESRAKLAGEKGIVSYRGTAAQNETLLGLLQKETGKQAPKKRPTPRKGEGIVDYMKRAGMNSSYVNRERLARVYGISGYRGTGKQNMRLLKLIAEGD
ncbi:N-acetylmuramoyl-L-alanine amidase [Shouchella patagoniensis]|uniref:N-acetylmuramoyl-L-alanine amidase n=1 Tax=Shouchella patagoniensis TaxID=228576 RepID=UPI00099493DE|nr:N-acetylmuramoyl-L-alanine amidase [Shouchella patagoniensis]